MRGLYYDVRRISPNSHEGFYSYTRVFRGAWRVAATIRDSYKEHSHMNCSLNSLKGGYIGDYIWDYYRGY